MWLEPKTDWVSSDYVNYQDYNRIKNNIAYLKSLAFLLYKPFECDDDLGDDKTSYSDFPYADEFNSLENNLDCIRAHTFAFFGDEAKQWYPNNRTPTFEDLNRLESACLKLYEGLNTQYSSKVRLSIRLGSMKKLKV